MELDAAHVAAPGDRHADGEDAELVRSARRAACRPRPARPRDRAGRAASRQAVRESAAGPPGAERRAGATQRSIERNLIVGERVLADEGADGRARPSTAACSGCGHRRDLRRAPSDLFVGREREGRRSAAAMARPARTEDDRGDVARERRRGDDSAGRGTWRGHGLTGGRRRCSPQHGRRSGSNCHAHAPTDGERCCRPRPFERPQRRDCAEVKPAPAMRDPSRALEAELQAQREQPSLKNRGRPSQSRSERLGLAQDGARVQHVEDVELSLEVDAAHRHALRQADVDLVAALEERRPRRR